MNPTERYLYEPSVLPDLMISHFQADKNFVAANAAPICPTTQRSGKYQTINSGDMNRDEAGIRAPFTEASKGGFRQSTESFYCEEYSYKEGIADQHRAELKGKPRELKIYLDNKTRSVVNKLKIRWERKWAGNCFATSKWTHEFTGAASNPGATQFLMFNKTNSDPISVVEEMRQQVQLQSGGMDPNVLICGPEVYKVLKNHSQIIERIKYTSSETVIKEVLARYFEVDKFIVPKSVYNTAAKNKTASETNAFICGPHMLLAYLTGAPSIEEPSAMYTFMWTNLVESLDGYKMKEFRDENNACNWVEGTIAIDPKITDQACGVFMKNCVD